MGILILMLFCAFAGFALLVWLTRRGSAGLALTVVSILGGVLAILIYAAGRPFGIDPVGAMTAAMLCVLPALMGGIAGGLLGRILRKRDDQRRDA
ncbi:UDP-N-acetylmuramate--alanine ligase [Yoonia sp. SS1-5]|uniref:UDP-N-acetylmuramate--alanine ligase n=1 Tax=Yoonia rhodophyticola TaxID=3137370 RepID=A0AAN0MBZ5_9RHOB